MNKPRIFSKSLLIEGSNSKRGQIPKFCISTTGYICKSSENYSYTVYKCQQADINLVFEHVYLRQYLQFLTPLIFSELKTYLPTVLLQSFAIKTKYKRHC